MQDCVTTHLGMDITVSKASRARIIMHIFKLKLKNLDHESTSKSASTVKLPKLRYRGLRLLASYTSDTSKV